MKLRTEDHGAWCDAMGRRHTAWTAIDEDTYDGAEDSKPPFSCIGIGATEADAIADLMEQLDELEAAESAGRV